jgi:2-hydroxy-3-keto-5-methylthiopentenyl-1-phosphate phosphatase
VPVEKYPNYKAIVSSDWNECLAPCGPFDVISFNHAELAPDLATIFQQYTGNIISLGEATTQIQNMLPVPITKEQMDAYLDKCFVTYKGVPDLIEWCISRNILFMVNTTGMVGYFQRVFAKSLLPPVPVVSAHPMIRYPEQESDPHYAYDLLEIRDKGRNTEAVARSLSIPPEKIILIGDSGGDGPHFEWGAGSHAFLIGSMIKPSLERYCQNKGIVIDFHFGLSYAEGEKRDPKKEMKIDFMDLSFPIEQFLNQ